MRRLDWLLLGIAALACLLWLHMRRHHLGEGHRPLFVMPKRR